ncbi:GNAT family protein [Bacillus sp. FJAT-52991]|uniref:GNAT family protein n=1 Tax=Bacillus kandeliae TaxID=3129297 RepID=A0ABZ2N2A6_9BACI
MDISVDQLNGKNIQIVPMSLEHIQGLYAIGTEEAIWEHLPETIQTKKDMKSFVEEALAKKRNGSEFPFIILLRENNKVIGTTRFLSLCDDHRNLEIGWTWFAPAVWGTHVNIECKYLLLRYCFEVLNLIRVQFKTDERNIRSQKAIERIGGVKEGILRNHMIRKDGTFRDSIFYSIISSEWPSVKKKLEARLTEVVQ